MREQSTKHQEPRTKEAPEPLLDVQVKVEQMKPNSLLHLYHEIVQETPSACGKYLVRVGLACNLCVFYIWIRAVEGDYDRGYWMTTESILNGVIPLLLPLDIQITEKGKAAAAMMALAGDDGKQGC